MWNILRICEIGKRKMAKCVIGNIKVGREGLPMYCITKKSRYGMFRDGCWWLFLKYLKKEGESCSRDFPCGTGLTCAGGKCVKTGSVPQSAKEKTDTPSEGVVDVPFGEEDIKEPDEPIGMGTPSINVNEDTVKKEYGTYILLAMVLSFTIIILYVVMKGN